MDARGMMTAANVRHGVVGSAKGRHAVAVACLLYAIDDHRVLVYQTLQVYGIALGEIVRGLGENELHSIAQSSGTHLKQMTASL